MPERIGINSPNKVSREFLVKHQNSQKIFQMKQIILPYFLIDQLAVMEEKEILVKCVKVPHSVVLLDSFIEGDQLTLIIEHPTC